MGLNLDRPERLRIQACGLQAIPPIAWSRSLPRRRTVCRRVGNAIRRIIRNIDWCHVHPAPSLVLIGALPVILFQVNVL